MARLFPVLSVLVVHLCFRAVRGEREHKVHGIVLYPERHSWCQTTPIKQVVASPGYESATIDNNVCVGACYSYSIPKTQPAEPGELIGPYCDSCQPAETKCYHVTLRADGKNLDGPRTVQKRVEIITNCSCMSCDTKQRTDCDVDNKSTLELPPDLFASLHANKTRPDRPAKVEEEEEEDTPELLDLASNRGRPAPVASTEERFKLNARLINLLKSVRNSGAEGADRDRLSELLAIVEGGGDRLDDKSLMDFVNFINVNHSEDGLDLGRLMEVLNGLRKDQGLAERHRDFGLGNAKVEDLMKKHDLPADFGIEGSRLGMMAHAKGSHVGMGIHPVNSLGVPEDETKHRKHHAGDQEMVGDSLGKLILGPHGSLALKIEEKLHLNSDLVKPNHEGLVMGYESHLDPVAVEEGVSSFEKDAVEDEE